MDYTKTWCRAKSEAMLKKFSGLLQTDGFKVYEMYD